MIRLLRNSSISARPHPLSQTNAFSTAFVSTIMPMLFPAPTFANKRLFDRFRFDNHANAFPRAALLQIHERFFIAYLFGIITDRLLRNSSVSARPRPLSQTNAFSTACVSTIMPMLFPAPRFCKSTNAFSIASLFVNLTVRLLRNSSVSARPRRVFANPQNSSLIASRFGIIIVCLFRNSSISARPRPLSQIPRMVLYRITLRHYY